MKAGFVRELLGRSDYAIIGEIVEPRTKVLDLGCGEGELLEWLAKKKNVDARGLEISGAKVQRAIARGVSVFQSDIDAGLADYPDQVFDYVILSQTLQEMRHPLQVLREMLRVAAAESWRSPISATGACATPCLPAAERRAPHSFPTSGTTRRTSTS